jgi:8-hydroxy-5-deazaflavin:NADPH oxidoreductase
VNIGIIGSGNMGASMGKISAAQGHKVLFSFSKDQEKLRAVAAAAGPNGRTGTPAGAVAFGEVILFSVPWAAVPEALKAAGTSRARPCSVVSTA